MNYADITLNDPNFIKRYLQRTRFNSALTLHPAIGQALNVLDFGGGDGELTLRLNNKNNVSNYICYEPTPSMFAQAKKKLNNHKNIKLINTLSTIGDNTIDVIYALEVFEHLPKKESDEALAKINSLLKPGGTLIIGVPNEIFIPAIYKGLFRMTRRFGQYDATPKNIISCFFGLPPKDRPTGEISPGKKYHFHHLGFDHRQLKKTLKDTFIFKKQTSSPFPFVTKLINPEIYYLVNKATT